MENYEYEKLFSGENGLKKDIDPDSDEAEKIRKFLKSYEKALANCRYYIHPLAPKLFEETVRDCEQIAKEFSGRIKATINYTSFFATIELWCCYVEFRRSEFMHILQKISHRAIIVRLIPTTYNDLHIQIEMPYFVLENKTHESE